MATVFEVPQWVIDEMRRTVFGQPAAFVGLRRVSALVDQYGRPLFGMDGRPLDETRRGETIRVRAPRVEGL